MNREFSPRKHPRLDYFDYSTAGAYFVTICTQNRKCLLSRVVAQDMGMAQVIYTPYGKIAEEQLFLLEKRYPNLKIDQYVIMPNHIHVLFVLGETKETDPKTDICSVVCAYKSLTTRACKKEKPIDKIFQVSFYEHVVRNRKDYQEIVEYITNNPK